MIISIRRMDFYREADRCDYAKSGTYHPYEAHFLVINKKGTGEHWNHVCDLHMKALLKRWPQLIWVML